MVRKTILLGILVMFGSTIGCEGKKNELATDNGEMTLAEFEAMQAEEEAKISESMKAPAK